MNKSAFLSGVEKTILELKHTTDSIRETAVYYSMALDADQIVEPLIAAFAAEGNATIRATMARALGILKDRRAIEPLLLAVTTDRSPVVRHEAANALGELDGREEVVEPLIAVLSAPNEHKGNKMDVNVVSSIVFALRKLNDARAVEPLIDALERKDEQTRAVIALSLGSFGDIRAVEPLLNLLYDDEPLIRRAAACALGDLSDQRAVLPLIDALTDPDFETRSGAIKSLGLLGDRRAIEPLCSLLQQDRIPYRRVFIIGALDRLGATQAVRPLIALLQNSLEEEEVRAASIETLGHLGDKSATPFLLNFVTDFVAGDANELRWRAVVALGQLGDTRAIDRLSRYRTDPEPVMRMAVISALRQLKTAQTAELLPDHP
ncbi:hypothetical protein KDH_17480 [Dictyobacter sp. S3.2.2.5]|uniref:HEAT repeat domain-containing protein n=1 Tax=Dictyobacter halimunensis TaxID=3026934 RepID=A0ABQ6FKV0_9CHLR|nr:hypothetical protein KDH_16980 [Dictyobacter sp. S3.2.2.5]GLV54901.1 hypothetical protein KDH_17480 [Dictyobacter sp. S3.2.2.5]